MTREEAKQELEGWRDVAKYDGARLQSMQEVNPTLAGALDMAIEALQERKAGKWIPVTERLPEEKLAVLVWCPQRSNIYCAYHDKRNVNKVVYSEWFIFGAFNTLVNENVVAWMPLPEPYKEVDE